MEPALEMAGYGLLMWVTGFAMSHKILVGKKVLESIT